MLSPVLMIYMTGYKLIQVNIVGVTIANNMST